MIGFMVFLIKRLSYTIGRKIHFDVIKKLSVYDKLIDEKSNKLQALNSQVSKIHSDDKTESIQEKKFIPVCEKTKTDFIINAKYMDNNFPKVYKLVRNQFQFDKDNVISSFKRKIDTNQKIENIYESILKKFSFNNFYNISTLSSDNQINIFKEFFDDNQKEILDEYIKTNKNFNSLKFYNYIKNMSKKYDNRIYIRTCDPLENYNDLENGIFTIYDDNLCEGFCIVWNNYLYDYSITKMEIC